MRIPVIATVGGLLAMTALAAPLLPDDTVSDNVYAPAGRAVTQVAQAGVEGSKNVLRVAALRELDAKSPIDFDNLIRINGKDFEASYSENFSDEVQNLRTVRKIGYGKSTEVSIITTPSGTYSTDGLASPNVLYPDIETRRTFKNDHHGLKARVWHRGFGWMPHNFSSANSIVTFGRIQGGGKFISGDGQTCFKGPNYRTCN